MYPVIIIWVLLVTSTATVSSTPTRGKVLPSKGFTAKGLYSSAWESSMRLTESSIHAGPAEVIPWQCFAKQEKQMCSCTIVSQDYVLARSSCIRNGMAGKVQVHAGAFNSSNANQIVDASLLATSEPPPEGVVALKLDAQLSFNEKVSKISLIDYRDDVRHGIVRGFGYNNTNDDGAFESKFCRANVFKGNGTRGRLYVIPADCGLPPSTSYESTRWDFLDLYDQLDNEIYFLGGLETRQGVNAATYYNVRDMRQWMLEHLPGVTSS